jgi:uncharacterized protein YlzI (FlbEa/FlbD family)
LKKETRLELTNRSGQTVLVDPEDISNIRDGRESTEIFFKSGGSIFVKESIWTINEKLP